MHVIRVATQNIWGFHGDWPARRPVLRDGLADLDLVALQEAFDDQPRELACDREVAHHDDKGVAILSRWPIVATHALESDTLVAEIDAPVGRLVFVNHAATYELDRELAREREAVDVARFAQELHADHVVLAGDLNARPETASVRFLRGLQSSHGTSVCFLDAWEAARGADPGQTFTPENPTMPTGEGGKWRLEPGRRVDYVLVRCGSHGPTLEVRRASGCSTRRWAACGRATTLGWWRSWRTSACREAWGISADRGVPRCATIGVVRPLDRVSRERWGCLWVVYRR